jgi:hypothetical protein
MFDIKRLFYILPLGLGLGLGLSLVIFSQPALTTASLPASDPTETTTITQFSFPQREIKLNTKPQNSINLINLKNPQVCFNEYCQLNSNYPTVVFTTTNLDQVQLGDSVKTLGENQGIYTYQVSEIINAPSQELVSKALQFPHNLVIAYPDNMWRTSLQLIIAKPRIL